MSAPTEVEDIASTPLWVVYVPLGSRSPWVGGGCLGRRTLGTRICITVADLIPLCHNTAMHTAPPNLPPPLPVTILNHMSRREGPYPRTSILQAHSDKYRKTVRVKARRRRCECRLLPQSCSPPECRQAGINDCGLPLRTDQQLNLTPAKRARVRAKVRRKYARPAEQMV